VKRIARELVAGGRPSPAWLTGGLDMSPIARSALEEGAIATGSLARGPEATPMIPLVDRGLAVTTPRRGQGELFVCIGDEVAVTFRGVLPLEEILVYARMLRRQLGRAILGPACLEVSPVPDDEGAVRVALWGAVGASSLRVEASGNLFIAVRDAFHALDAGIRALPARLVVRDV
jgi:hypothetical protein